MTYFEEFSPVILADAIEGWITIPSGKSDPHLELIDFYLVQYTNNMSSTDNENSDSLALSDGSSSSRESN